MEIHACHLKYNLYNIKPLQLEMHFHIKKPKNNT